MKKALTVLLSLLMLTAIGFSADTTVTNDAGTALKRDYRDDVKKMKQFNSDAVGWLTVPGAGISEIVMHRPDDKTNMQYYRLDYKGGYSFTGTFYADFRAVFGDGSRAQLGTNTCIYGHTMSDDPQGDLYRVKFGPLHNFRDEAFARSHPYFYFSTEKETLTFEVVAVIIANAGNPELAYNSNMSGSDYIRMFEEGIKPRSLYHYSAAIDETDKFMTLSTVIYHLRDGAATSYPNSNYRYAVIGRLVDAGQPLRKTADLVVNKNPLLDPDGQMA